MATRDFIFDAESPLRESLQLLDFGRLDEVEGKMSSHSALEEQPSIVFS